MLSIIPKWCHTVFLCVFLLGLCIDPQHAKNPGYLTGKQKHDTWIWTLSGIISFRQDTRSTTNQRCNMAIYLSIYIYIYIDHPSYIPVIPPCYIPMISTMISPSSWACGPRGPRGRSARLRIPHCLETDDEQGYPHDLGKLHIM